MKIDIIGAGIGGLTTAIALQAKGFDVTVFDQATELKPVGAGIILANNAMQVYDKMGLRSAIEANGNPISSMNLTNPKLTPISKVDLQYFEKKYKVRNIAIHRATLQQILVDKLNEKSLQLGFKLKTTKKREHEYLLHFDEGRVVQSRVSIGADGLNSTVRNALFSKSKIRNAKQICWRGVTEFDLPKNYQTELNEAWGNGDRFGFVQIEPGKVYWYALKTYKHDKDALATGGIDHHFGKYHPMVAEIINSTPRSNIHTAEILDLKPGNDWYQEKVCLLGDAAHATMPNMGQGACQAIEDAYVLSECMGKYEPEKAFSTYQELRMPKAHWVVNTSWTLGKIAHLSSPLLVKIRNQIMRATPQSVNRSQSEKIFQLSEI